MSTTRFPPKNKNDPIHVNILYDILPRTVWVVRRTDKSNEFAVVMDRKHFACKLQTVSLNGKVTDGREARLLLVVGK